MNADNLKASMGDPSRMVSLAMRSIVREPGYVLAYLPWVRYAAVRLTGLPPHQQCKSRWGRAYGMCTEHHRQATGKTALPV